MKRFIMLCIGLMLLTGLFFPCQTFSDNPMKVQIDGEPIHLSGPILVEQAGILVPVRSTFGAFSAQVKWDPSNQSILATKDQTSIWLQVNNYKAKIGHKEILLDMPIKLINGHAVMPLTFIQDAFAVDIKIDQDGDTINIFDATYGIPLTAKANILVEPKSGLILLEHNAHERLPVANLSKSMVLLLVFDAIENGDITLQDVITISESAAAMQGQQLFLRAGDEVTVETLVKSIAMMGANDSTMAMAEHIAGNGDGFITLMNRRARDLGLKDTWFTNISGVDNEDQYSSAYDLAIISRELITSYPEVLEFSSTLLKQITYPTKGSEKRVFDMRNSNKLLKSYNGAQGLMTGYNIHADFCIIGIAEKKGLQLISVTLGAPNSQVRYKETMAILDYGFEGYDVLGLKN